MKSIYLLFFAIFTETLFSQNAFYESQYYSALDEKLLQEILDNSETSAFQIPDPEDITKTIRNSKYFPISETERNSIKELQQFLRIPFTSENIEIDYQTIAEVIEKWYQLKLIVSQNIFLQSDPNNHSAGIGITDFLPFNLIGSSSSLFINGVNNLNLDTLILSYTKFIAEEFKTAQTITYLNIFKNTADKYGEFKLLFPTTYQKLQTLDPSRLPNLGGELKDVFNDDLGNVLTNLIFHIDSFKESSSNYFLLTDENVTKIRGTASYQYLKAFNTVCTGLMNKSHPTNILNTLDYLYYNEVTKTGSPMYDLGIIFHGVNIIQSNLIDTSKQLNSQYSNIWIDFQKLRSINTTREKIYFFGLIYQQDKKYFDQILSKDIIKKLKNKSFDDISVIIADIDSLIDVYINRPLAKMVELQDYIHARNGVLQEDDYAQIANQLIALLSSYPSSNGVKKYFKIADDIVQISDGIYKKEYQNTYHYIFDLLKELFNEVPNNSYSELLQKNSEILLKLEHYTAFAAEIINAKNSEETKVVISTYVKPKVNYLDKRVQSFVVSVTSLPGYYAGFEFKPDYDHIPINTGLTLPLCVDFSFNKSSGNLSSGNCSIVLQFIDLGSVLNYTLTTDTATAGLPEDIQISDLFSPGASFNYGFNNSPLTLGIGYQFTPTLRSISMDGNVFEEGLNRIFLRISWDVTLLGIYNSARKNSI